MLTYADLQGSGRTPASTSLRDLATPLFRHRKMLLVSFVVVFTGAQTFLSTRPKQYKSHLEILVNRERTDPLVSTEATSETGTPKVPVTEQEVNSEAELIQSGDILRQVVLANHLQGDGTGGSWLGKLLHRSHTSESARVDTAVSALGGTLDVKTIPKSNLFEVSYASQNPDRTYGVLHSLGQFYLDRHFALQRSPGAYDFFSREADRYQSAMLQAEQQLRELGQGGQLAAPELQRAALATQVGDLLGRWNATTEAISADQSRIREEEARLQTTHDRIVTAQTTTPASMLLQQLGADVLHAQQKRTDLAQKYNATYPLVTEADQELRNAQAALAKAERNPYISETTDNDPTHELIRQDLLKTRADLAAQQGSLRSAQENLGVMRQHLAQLDGAVLDQEGLRRTQKANEDNFLMYQAKREQERASAALDRIRIGNVAIAVPPSIPVIPVAPRVPNVLVSLAAAAVLSLILCYVAAYFDPALHAPSEVEEVLGIPVLVAVPRRTAA